MSSSDNKNLINSKKNRFKAEVISLAQVIALALIIRALILELFFIPSGSMKLNLLEGDYIFATKYSYGYSRYSLPFSPNLFQGRIFANEPFRGDIIILKPPSHHHDRFIKRLIGLPKDKIQIKDDIIYINDQPIKREFEGSVISEEGDKYLKFKETLPEGNSFYSYKLDKKSTSFYRDKSNTGEFYVPEGHYFFMGDNRDNSDDSRYSLGFVPFENLIAKARFVIFSASKTIFSQIEDMKRTTPWSWLQSIRLNRIFSKIYL